jgi:hypothetical protein
LSNEDRSEYDKKKREFEAQRAENLKNTAVGLGVLETIKHRREEVFQREWELQQKSEELKVATTNN